jgi:hypothetical protein
MFVTVRLRAATTEIWLNARTPKDAAVLSAERRIEGGGTGGGHVSAGGGQSGCGVGAEFPCGGLNGARSPFALVEVYQVPQ